MKIRLDNILSKWINSHPYLKKYYKVYKYSEWNHYNHEWPDILDGVEAFVGMKCDGIGVALAIMDDHVYYKKRVDSDPKIKTMAADKNFFKAVEEDLKDFHRSIHKNDDCDPIF